MSRGANGPQLLLVAAASVRVVGNLYDVPLDEIHIGMAVHAFWQERSDEFGTVLLPQWSPT